MARYIDADKVMEEVNRIGGHNLCEWQTIGVKALIDRQPTADVVPRAEAEEYKHNWQKIHDGYTADCLEHYNKGRTEVAREIFAEIEKIRFKEIHKCETLRERENEVSQRKYWEGGYNSLRQLSYWIAELKKKYT